MPRDIHLASPRPLRLADLVAAGAEVDETLAVRGLQHGSVIQLVDAGDIAILTVENSRQLIDAADAKRIAPNLAIPDAVSLGGEVWWTEASAPWGTAGEAGVAVTEALARIMNGTLIVEDGS
jgi:hypothetical protein